MNANVVEAEFKDIPQEGNASVESPKKKLFNFICVPKDKDRGITVISLTDVETTTHEELLEEIVLGKGGIIFKGDLYPIIGAKNIALIRPYKEELK